MSRNLHEKAKVIARDECYIITHTKSPNIYHIFPYTAKTAPDQIQITLDMLSSLWGDEVKERMARLLIGDGNIIDTAPTGLH
jgi:hypothetical protein